MEHHIASLCMHLYCTQFSIVFNSVPSWYNVSFNHLVSGGLSYFFYQQRKNFTCTRNSIKMLAIFIRKRTLPISGGTFVFNWKAVPPNLHVQLAKLYCIPHCSTSFQVQSGQTLEESPYGYQCWKDEILELNKEPLHVIRMHILWFYSFF